MDNSTNINIELLNELIFELIKDGREILPSKELEEMYMLKVEIINKTNEIRQKIASIQKYGHNGVGSARYKSARLIEIENLLYELSQRNDAKSVLEKLSDISKELEEMYNTKKEIMDKINEIRQKKLYLNTYGFNRDFIERYKPARLIEIENLLDEIAKSNDRKSALKQLSDISKELEEMYLPKVEIMNKIHEIKEKITSIKNSRHVRTISAIYKSNLPKEIEKMLYEISQTKDKQSALEQLSELSNKLDEELRNINTLYKIDKYRKYNSYTYDYYIEYDINGIIIEIDSKTKKYKISCSDEVLNLLTECKTNKLNKLLSDKLPSISSSEIIEPKYVNERKLSDFINRKTISIKDNLKYNINGLLRYLSLDTEMKKDSTIEELSLNHPKIKAFYEFIQILDKQGYTCDEDKRKSVFEDIVKKYQSINLELIKDIYTSISQTILKRYPDENFIYSSMQIVYNCVDRELIKLMHQELSSGEKIEKSEYVKSVIEFIKKYSRNKDGLPYKDDEIINFLKQKNEIIHTQYSLDSYDYGAQEYADTTNYEVNSIMYKMTGRHR